ncbi:MAG: TlyA family rRNA (cytidine-2'-O)-methyltransferase [Phycisphaerales bacterium]|jgi:23S rRNA (cytidine1920-2'-O)/16S rRNA (cytidine1409-2'-O)-methyltransferase|nr:TlyA family rRNA (cytidine-2'-O)-methyltransferase [Phycisphaerales bacterium]
MAEFASRAGFKLEHALNVFRVDVAGLICADLGSNTGGFVDCLLQHGAAKVYSIDTGYGVLDWKLRKDPRVVVMERTNAMHVQLPEAVSLVTIDVAWTRQRNILPAAIKMLAPNGTIISLIKPHYEAEGAQRHKGILNEEAMPRVIEQVRADITAAGMTILAMADSPIRGGKGNRELLAYLQPVSTDDSGPA